MMEHAQEVENNENAVLNMSGAFEIEKLTVCLCEYVGTCVALATLRRSKFEQFSKFEAAMVGWIRYVLLFTL